MQKKFPLIKRHFTLLDYIANLLSAKEGRYSTIAFILLGSFGVQVYSYITKTPVPTWASDNVKACIYGLAGINAIGMGLSYMGYGYMENNTSTPSDIDGDAEG